MMYDEAGLDNRQAIPLNQRPDAVAQVSDSIDLIPCRLH